MLVTLEKKNELIVIAPKNANSHMISKALNKKKNEH